MKKKRVIIRPEAESDIEDAYQWYESQRKGLGEDFLLCVEEALSRASRNPAIYSIIKCGKAAHNKLQLGQAMLQPAG